MVINDPSILECLHDATVFEINYDLKDREDRSMILSVRCDPDAGYAAWDGKRLMIRLECVVLMSFSAFAPATSMEQVNTWGSTVSDSMASEVQRLQGLGYDCKGASFSIAFQSGSVLEGLCKRITAEEVTALKP